MRRPTELRATVGALRLTGTSDLHEEFAVRGELEDLVVFVAVAGNPDVAFRVDVDAMFALRPLPAASRPAAQVVPGGIELGHRRQRLAAAMRPRSRVLRIPFIGEQRAGAVDDPDVAVAVVDRDAGHL